MYNDLFSIGPFTIHTYGLMIWLGIMAALYTGELRAKKRQMNADVIFTMVFLCVAVGFICAKALYCIVEWKDFLEHPMRVLSMDGFVVYGGIAGGVLTEYLYCRLRKFSFWDYFDLMLPSVALAQGFGRIGCFFAGCCYGKETDLFFGIVFKNTNYAPIGVKLIPTQLISSLGMFLIAGILFYYAKKPRKQGRVGALYLILYSVGRFFIEFFRDDFRGMVGLLSTSQFISLFILALGILLFVSKRFPAGRRIIDEKAVNKTDAEDDNRKKEEKGNSEGENG